MPAGGFFVFAQEMWAVTLWTYPRRKKENIHAARRSLARIFASEFLRRTGHLRHHGRLAGSPIRICVLRIAARQRQWLTLLRTGSRARRTGRDRARRHAG